MAPEEMENGESSLKKKVATGVAVGLATTAAAGVAKKMLDGGGDDDLGEQSDQGDQGSREGESRGAAQSSRARSATSRRGTSRSGSSSSRQRASSKARSKAKSTSTSAGRGANRTKEQLYRQAKRLGVEGRSKMTKAQLERAVARAK